MSRWIAVTALGVASFAIVTTELAPIGMLTPMAADLGRSTSSMGLVVSLYAWVGALAAVLSATVLSRLPRRTLLVGLMVLLAGSAAASGLAQNFGALLVARLAGALAHGAFWAFIGSLAAQLVPERQIGRATAIIFGGVSAASVFGVPLANYLEAVADWRSAFYGVAALALLVAAALRTTLPALPGQAPIRLRTLGQILIAPHYRCIFATAILVITAHFMAFTYLEPFLRAASLSPTMLAALLLVFGAAGLLANVLCGAWIDRHLKRFVIGAACVSSVALLTLALPGLGDLPLVIAGLLAAWGGAISVMLVGLQTWVIREAKDEALPASAIYVALFNVAIGLGSFVGGAVLAETGMSGLLASAGLVTATGLLVLAIRDRRFVAEPETQ